MRSWFRGCAAALVVVTVGCHESVQPMTPSSANSAPAPTTNVTITFTPSSASERIENLLLESGFVRSGTNSAATVQGMVTPGGHSLWFQTQPGRGQYTISFGSVPGSTSGVIATSIAVLSSIGADPGTTVTIVNGCVVTVSYSQMARIEVGFLVLPPSIVSPMCPPSTP